MNLVREIKLVTTFIVYDIIIKKVYAMQVPKLQVSRYVNMTFSEKIPSCLEVIPQFISSVMDKLRQLLTEEEIFDVKLCFEEALVNAVKHGNKLKADLFVEVVIEVQNRCLTLKVIDQGQGYDYKSIPDPTKPDNLQKLSGRGMFLIKRLMDEVEFFDGGRGIKMIKFLSKEAGSEDKKGKTQ